MSRDRTTRRLADRSGFTLVEVMVAFTVLTLLLSVLFRGVVGMRAGSVAFGDRTKREIELQAVLEGALADRTLAPGIRSGHRNGLRWKVIAKPIDLSAQMPPPAPGATETGDTQRQGQNQGQAQDQSQAQGPQTATGAPATARKPKTEWQPQRLTVEIESRGRPLVLETIRLVKVRSEP